MNVEDKFNASPHTRFSIKGNEEEVFPITARTTFYVEVNNMSEIWLPPFHCVEGDEVVFTGPWTNLDVSSVAQKIYEGLEDKTSTLASGSSTVTNNVATFAEISGFTGGKEYVVTFQATTTGGQKYTMKRMLIVERKTDVQ